MTEKFHIPGQAEEEPVGGDPAEVPNEGAGPADDEVPTEPDTTDTAPVAPWSERLVAAQRQYDEASAAIEAGRTGLVSSARQLAALYEERADALS